MENLFKTLFVIIFLTVFLFYVKMNIKCANDYWDSPYLEVPYKCRMFMK